MNARLIALATLASLVAPACSSDAPSAPVSQAAKFAADVSAAAAARIGGPPGSVVFYSSRAGAPSKIYVMNPDGSGQQIVTSGAGADIWPDISPNGRYIAFASNRTGNNEIWVLELAAGHLWNVSNHTGDDNWPRWSPNGQQIAFHSNRDGNYNLYVVNADGSGLRRVTSDAALDQWPDWSPNGKQLAFRRGMDVYVVDVQGEEQNVRRLTNVPATLDQMPVWSPNGKQLAFMSLREGYPSVFLMSAQGDTQKNPAVNLTPKNPGDLNSAWLSRAPAWSMNGKQIYFMSFRPPHGTNVEIYVMDADGANVKRLTDAAGEDGGPQLR
jgi:Tol biopolymer transport system component